MGHRGRGPRRPTPCCAPACFGAARPSSTAALQVALKAITALYSGDLDGPARTGALVGGPDLPAPRRAWAADGVAGRRHAPLRSAARGRPKLGRRALRSGRSGWDVAALQWLLARAGFPSGSVDGGFGARTDRALRRFQARAGLAADGIAGPATIRALRRPSPQSPLAMRRPVRAPTGDRFRFRGARLHAGVDFPAATGAAVSAARSGTVAQVGYDPAGWGNFVVIAHGAGVRTLYAHLSSVSVRPGRRVSSRTTIGGVGSTGASTGPHLHFEVTSRGANVDPLRAIR
jgi:peptidoglycan hydrolase-like protein with peptidoglycan-binding domain